MNRWITIIDSQKKNCLTDKVDFIKSVSCNQSDDNQLWEIIPNATLEGPWVSIRNKGTGRLLTNVNSDILKTEQGCEPVENTTQVFYLRVNLYGISLINQASKKCAKLAVSNNESKGDLIQVECSETGNELSWIINFLYELPSQLSSNIQKISVLPPSPVQPAPAPKQVLPAFTPVTPIETGKKEQPLKDGSCFFMENVDNKHAVSFGGGNNNEVTNSLHRRLDETVCVENGPNGAYFIHWKKDYKKVFDIFESRQEDGTRLIKFPKHGGKNQQFRFLRNAQGDYQFVSVHSGKAFGVWNGVAVQKTISNERQQFWKLIPA